MTSAELTPIQAITLALTIPRPHYPYELANRVEHGVCGSFIKVNKTATYSALKRLEVLGLVSTVEQHGEARRQRLTKRRWDQRCWYRATAKGLDAYQRWLTSKKQLDLESERTEILGRIASAARLGTHAILTVLDDCEELCEQREQAITAIHAHTASDPIDALCDRLVIAERKIAVRALREWIRLARAHVHAYEQRHASDGYGAQDTARHLAATLATRTRTG